jgi:hypothetical protein
MCAFTALPCLPLTVLNNLHVMMRPPSAVATILKYRCQILPSLGSEYFVKYRTAADTVSRVFETSC